MDTALVVESTLKNSRDTLIRRAATAEVAARVFCSVHCGIVGLVNAVSQGQRLPSVDSSFAVC